MKNWLLTILLAFASAAFAQDPVISMNITTKDDDTGKKLAGATVVVKTGGSVFVTKQSASNGKVPVIDLPLGQNYTVYIQKEGYVTKVATIDAHYDYPEDLPPFIPFPIQTSLFKSVEGVDFKWLETTPMIKFELDQYGNQTWDQAYTKDMLKKIADLKEELAKKKEEEEQKKKEFDQFVAAGNKGYTASDWQVAIDNYEKALALFDDAEVKKKLEDAKKKLEEEGKAAEIEKAFQDKMAAAKTAFDNKEYEKALGLYKEASEIKPSEQLPKDRIKEIQKILDEQKANQEKFDKFVADGDAAVGSEDYDKAIENYESALGIKEDAGVKQKLEDAKKKKKEKEEAEQAEKEKKEQYDKLIADADKAFDAKSYEDAKSKYQEALNLFPKESHPAARLSEIEGILKKLKEEEEAAKKLEEDYKKLIQEGDAAFNTKDWDGAIAKYEEALKLKAGEQHPTDQIKKAKENKENEAAEKELNEQYNQLLTDGKGLMNGENYTDAISKFEEASKLKPSEQEPKDLIAECKQKIQDQQDAEAKEAEYKKFMEDGQKAQDKDDLEGALSNYESAIGVKPGDTQAQNKINEVKELIAQRKANEEQEEKFNELVKKGDDAKNAKKYQDAIDKYTEALAIKDDADVKAKKTEAEELLKQEKEQAENQKKFDEAMASADAAFNGEDWDKAIEKYNEALSYMDSQKAKDQIALAQKRKAEAADAEEKEKMFNDLVAEGDQLGGEGKYADAIRKYEEAIALKPDVKVSQKIADLKEKQKQEQADAELQAQYDAKIKEADAAFDAKNWPEAKALYNEAINIKDETYPKDRLKEIDQRIADEKAQEADAEYKAIIDKADQLRDEEKFAEAILEYKKALVKRPGEAYPQGEIDKINELIKQREQEEANKEAQEQKYKDLIASADAAFNSKDYKTALKDYQEALKIKPSESHPTNRVNEIQKILDAQQADAELMKKFNDAMKIADDLFAAEKWMEAKSAYQDALDIKSDEQRPKDQIALCNKQLQNQSENEAEEQYQKILDVAQKKFDEEDYDKALELYGRALSMKPSDPLPQQKIDEINKLLADKKAQEEIDAKYNAAIKKADGLFTEKKWKDAKTAYEDALMIKSSEQYPKDRIELCNKNMQGESVDEAEEQYQKILKVAQKKFDEKNYERALELYERAKNMKPSDPLPQQRIDEINQILADLKAEKEKEEKYKKLIQQADNLFESSKWQEAMTVYMDALDIFDRKWPKDQIEKCRNNIKNNGDTADKQYQKLIAKADEYFDQQNYEKSRGLYVRATKLKPSDQYPKDRIKEIDNILNPPKEVVNKSGALTDYGPPSNETALDLELMLYEAKEQANEVELQDIYKQREDAQEALFQWERENYDETHVAKNYTEDLKDEIIDYQGEGEQGRQETTENVEEWRVAIIDQNSEFTNVQENDIQFQNKVVENINIEIQENNFDNDKPREEYEADVEQIKIENQERINAQENEQEDKNQDDKTGIDLQAEEHIDNDPNVDVARQNVIVDVEDMQVVNINKRNQDAWNQEDENFDTKEEQNMIVEDIIANNLESDIPRQDTELIVEETQVSLQEREEKNQSDQYDNSHQVVGETEKMHEDIQDDKFEANEKRKGYEDKVEEINLSYQEREENNSNDQTDKNYETKGETEQLHEDIQEDKLEADLEREKYETTVEQMNVTVQETENQFQNDQQDKNFEAKNETEKIHEDIQEDKFQANEKREGYEETVEEINLSYQNRENKNTADQEDVVMSNDQDLEDMEKDIQDFNKTADKKQEENADKNLNALENHIEHVGDDKAENEEALIESEQMVESLKDIDVNAITPEVANELGKKFPEGVTEETYTINDSRGIMKAFVVRRIVVSDGAGTVYEKTQTRYGVVSYTKNGQAISEYEWNDETSSGPRN